MSLTEKMNTPTDLIVANPDNAVRIVAKAVEKSKGATGATRHAKKDAIGCIWKKLSTKKQKPMQLQKKTKTTKFIGEMKFLLKIIINSLFVIVI